MYAEVFARIGEKRKILEIMKKRERSWLGQYLWRNLMLEALEGKVAGGRKKS